MKCCFDSIKFRDEKIARDILKEACEIQNNDAITARAKGYYGNEEIDNDILE